MDFHRILSLVLCSSFLVFLCSQCCSSELIKSLPGQPANVRFKQFSGYTATDPRHGRYLFYYFAEAQADDPLSRPLTVCFNGGPGCSSIGFGAFMEHGPFQPGQDGHLIQNQYSWNLESNMLYVESPHGVGFSYSNSWHDQNWNDAKTAKDNLVFLINWFREFPQYKSLDLFLTGESYAGHYIPQLAARIIKYNKQPNVTPINLKSIALGNPLLDIDISVQAGNFLWSHGAISDEALRLKHTVCNDSRFVWERFHGNISTECNYVDAQVSEEISVDIDPHNLLSSACLSSDYTNQFLPKSNKHTHPMIGSKLGESGDPCLQGRVYDYLNKLQVQKALHVNTTHLPYRWDFCKGPVAYKKDNIVIDVIPLVVDLLREGFPILLYSGDQDAQIPLTQTRIIANNIAKNLKLIPLTKYSTWYEKQQVGGWAQTFGGLKDGKNVTYLTFATVRGAAHEVPFTSPSQALTLFRSFLTGSPLPRPAQ